MRPKQSILFYTVAFVAMFSTRGMCETMSSDDIRRNITELAHATDFDDPKLVEKYRSLLTNNGQNYSVFVEMLHESENDRVLYMTLTIASEASDTDARRREVAKAAARLLTSRDSKDYPFTTQTALGELGKLGTGEHMSLVARFESDPNLLVRTAAKAAFRELKNREERNPSPVDSTQSIAPPMPFATTGAARQTSHHEAQYPSSFPIVPVAILALGIIGVIVVLLRRKSP